MADKIQRVRGTQDLFGEDIARFDHVVETFNRVRKLYGFRRVDVPIFEPTAVFARTLGETTDVVAKEMYSFEDRGGDSLTLRPEFTAGICRAYIQNGWQQHAPLKLAAHGPLFRYERPQKGRYRQFHQLDAEVIGAAEPAADVEVIALGAQLLSELGIADRVTLQLNTLGDAETRSAWRESLVAHFTAHQDALSGDSRERLAKNPLRILDSKAECDRPLVAAAPGIDAHMTSEAGAFFEGVQRGLQAAGVEFVRTPSLVRGFDYYRHTAFEFVTEHLGSQGTVIGGGRYDGLIETMGGPHTPAVGWAAGIERLGLLVAEPPSDPAIELTLIPIDVASEELAIELASLLRRSEIQIDIAYSGSEKRRFERAKKAGSLRVLNVNMRREPGIAGLLRIRDLVPDAPPGQKKVTRRIGQALRRHRD